MMRTVIPMLRMPGDAGVNDAVDAVVGDEADDDIGIIGIKMYQHAHGEQEHQQYQHHHAHDRPPMAGTMWMLTRTYHLLCD